jgi:sulfite reductase alpha subunit-like flavoprotein
MLQPWLPNSPPWNVGQVDVRAGWCLEIFPHNEKDKVSAFLDAYSTDFGQSTLGKIHDFGIDCEVTLGTLFSYVLDLFGKPYKHFIQQLATIEKDDKDKNSMLEVEFLKIAAKETDMKVADALLQFTALFTTISLINPRAYGTYWSNWTASIDRHLVVWVRTSWSHIWHALTKGFWWP